MSARKATRKLLALVVGCFALAALVGVGAQSNGMNGYSQIGATCHNPTADPTVTATITGVPATYTPANSYPLQVAVSGGPTAGGGFDMSVSAGILTTTDPNAKIQNGEATNANGDARSWAVVWQAPSPGTGTVTFYVAGVATNNDGKKSGDAWNTAVYTSNEAPSNQRPTISLTSPNGAQDWTGGSSHLITWTMSDDITPISSLVVYLNYSSSAGSGNIAGPLTGATSYSWLLPAIDASDTRVNATVIDGGGLKGYSQVLVPIVDSTRPTVLSALPTGTGVGVNDPVVIRFSESMATAATQASLSLVPDPGGWTYSWSQTAVPNDTLTANHAPFTGNTAYAATVSTGARDDSDPGNAMASQYPWTFTTVDLNSPPTISVTLPSGGESWTGGSVHNLDWTTADAENPAASLKVWVNYSVAGGPPFNFQILGLQGVAGDARPYAWTLPFENSASVVLSATVIDTGGRFGSGVSAAFEIDSTAPTVSLTNPLPGAPNVPINANIIVTWSELMNTASAEASFSLKDTVAWTSVTGAFSWAGSVMTFNPTAFLAPATQYSANLTVLASDDSLSGNFLVAPYTWTFTTASGADFFPPSVTLVSAIPDPQEVFLPVNVSALVQDDIAVGEVWLNVTPPAGGPMNLTMSLDSPSGRYYLERGYGVLGIHTFVIWAADSSGNWNSSSGQFLIMDTTPPAVSDPRADPNPVEVFAQTNVSAIVTDNYMLSTVSVNIVAPDLTATNLSMFSGPRYYRAYAADQLGAYAYTVWATDTTGYSTWATGQFVVRDTTRPVISDLTAIPNPVEVLSQANISAIVTDNYALTEVWVKVVAPDSTATNQSMSTGARFYFNAAANQIGTYSFEIWATDSSLNRNSSSGTFLSRDSLPPTADAGPDQTVPQNTVVTFDGSGTTDSFGIQSYSWSFDDGSGPVTLTGITAQHTFSNIGSFLVTLTVVDFGGNRDSDQMWVNVTDGIPPDANAGPDQTINAGQAANFDGSASTDNVGVVSFTWTFNDNGQVTLTGEQASHVFNNAGDFTVTLTVSDLAGLQDEDTLVVHVLSSDSQPPAAPLNLVVQSAGQGALQLTWTANTEPDLAGYRVYRSLSPGGPYVGLTPDAVISSTTYLDEGLEGGRTYYYVVTAVDTSGNESGRSNEASGYVEAVAATGSTVTDVKWVALAIPFIAVLALLAALVALSYRKEDKESQESQDKAETRKERD